MKNKDTIWPLVWTHFSSHADGRMRICCNTEHGGEVLDSNNKIINIQDVTDIDEYFNNDFYKNIRLQMLNGERPKICNSCYRIEDVNGTSVRQHSLNMYNIDEFIENTDKNTGNLNNVVVKSLDLSWSNVCNLQCKMCHPAASNQLEKEWKDLHNSIIISDNTKWEFDNLKNKLVQMSPTLTEILVTGGEPFLNKNFLQFCDYLCDNDFSKNITVTLHTNLTIMPKKFFEKLHKFKMIRLHISIDAVGELYEYIRYPGKWSVTDANIKKLAVILENHNNIEVEVHTVFQSYGIAGFVDLLKYFDQFSHLKNIKTIPHFIWPHMPLHASTTILPDKFKNKYKSDIITQADKMHSLDNTILYDQLMACIDLMFSSKKTHIAKDFQHWVNQQDTYRNQDSKKYIPWLYEFDNIYV